jgi:hypothetical protein
VNIIVLERALRQAHQAWASEPVQDRAARLCGSLYQPSCQGTQARLTRALTVSSDLNLHSNSTLTTPHILPSLNIVAARHWQFCGWLL